MALLFSYKLIRAMHMLPSQFTGCDMIQWCLTDRTPVTNIRCNPSLADGTDISEIGITYKILLVGHMHRVVHVTSNLQSGIRLECIRERPMTFSAYLQCISGGVSHHSLVISHVWKRSSTSHLLMNTGIY
ncbi:hypothetical protein T4E_1155 [Trichinella pseudospiralis]|uniref:Uncharacterized protein n=1 Tax=Trichinella pseudospiralis TaxID=6337 RepID=A0A0V0YIX5_TRIPS|nr:hypothetical protein T4E_1155 [Trichinella pseudospiralis]